MKPKATAIILTAILSLTGFRSTCQVIDSTSFKITSRLSFYSYEKNAELLVSAPVGLSNRSITIKLNISGKPQGEWKGKVEKAPSRVPVDLNLVSSTLKVEAEIIVSNGTPSGNNLTYHAKCNLVVLPPKPNEVKTDRLTGGVIVNRRQLFPFGFYCYSPVYPTLPEEEVVKGFNMIAPYQKIVPETFKERQAYMDRCAELGLKVHYNLLSVSGGGGVGSVMEGYSETQKRELLINEIKAFMDHPALLAWYISDEPTGHNVTPETLEEIYKVVKETDPWHPVSIVFMAPFLSSRKYANAVDIVMADPYPIPELPASMTGDVTAKLVKEFRFEKPVWMVPQAFGGGELWGREPSIQEIRSMTYQSVINGATGIQYFVRQGLNAFPKSVSTWNECGRMALEIAELTPWLLSDEEANYAESSSGNIIVTSRYLNGKLLILSVNRTNEPLRSDIRIYGTGNTKAKVTFENRSIVVNNGTISDYLPAFGSQAYLIDIRKADNNNFAWSKNMIKDSGFEDISSPGIPSACYAMTGSDRGATYFIDSREHLEGNHSLRMITPRDSCGNNLKFFPVIVSAGKSYIVSVWSKADPDQRFSTTGISKNDENRKNLTSPQYVEISLGNFGKANFVPTEDWRQFVTFVTIPQDTTIKVKTNVTLSMPGHGVAWFDMLQVIEDPLSR